MLAGRLSINVTAVTSALTGLTGSFAEVLHVAEFLVLLHGSCHVGSMLLEVSWVLSTNRNYSMAQP